VRLHDLGNTAHAQNVKYEPGNMRWNSVYSLGLACPLAILLPFLKTAKTRMLTIKMLCVLEFDMRKIVGLIPGIGCFVYFAFMLDDFKVSSLFGYLAMSIALGSVGYFSLNAPEGRRKEETAFGLTGKYRSPIHGTIIPTKIAIWIFALLIAVSVLGLTFHYNGY